MAKAQNFENHARFVPPFHFFIAPVLLMNVVWCAVRAVRALAWLMTLLVAIALFLLAFVSRNSPRFRIA